MLLDGRAGHRRAAGLGVSLIGLAAAFGIPKAPAADSTLRIGWNILRETRRRRPARRAANRPVWLSILGLSWFWAIGATLLSEFPSVATDALGADGHVVTLLLTMFAVGDRHRLDAVRAPAARRGQRPPRAVRRVRHHAVHLGFRRRR